MPDISSFGLTVAADPLVRLLCLLAISGVASWLLFRKYPVRRAIVRVAFLIILTVAFLRAGVIPYEPLQWTGSSPTDAAHAILKIAWWLWAAWFVVAVLRVSVTVERRPRDSKLLQDLLAGLVYLAAFFGIVAYVFDLPIKGLLATSGAVAIILGLAMQSTLGDVFSGIVLSFSRPYLPGDWINIDGGTEGRVIEMNWRATHVLTGRRDLAIIPNSTLAKSKIVNVSSPSGVHGIAISIQLAPDTPPSSAIEIIHTAILNCRLILATPPPTVIIRAITARFIELEVTFYVDQLSASTNAQNQLYDMIFRHLATAGMRLASPDDSPASSEETGDAGKSANSRLLDLVDIFRSLTPAERGSLALKLKPAVFGAGETLVTPGDVLHSLFIVGAGVLSISLDRLGEDVELERFGPADYYGEIGMLTGDAARAAITALTPATVYELSKGDLAPILEARPQVAHELGRALARRQALGRATESAALIDSVPANRLTSWFSERLHKLVDAAGG